MAVTMVDSDGVMTLRTLADAERYLLRQVAASRAAYLSCQDIAALHEEGRDSGAREEAAMAACSARIESWADWFAAKHNLVRIGDPEICAFRPSSVAPDEG